MTPAMASSGIRKYLAAIDWKLLVFLLLFGQVKLLLKVVAVLMIFIFRPNFRFGFRDGRLPLFYLAMIAIAVINLLLTGLFRDIHYDMAFVLGCGYWLLCLAAMHQVKLAVEINTAEAIYKTLVVYFILNAVVSLAVYTGIVIETGTINPYRYQGNYQKYFIGTGDYIKGISFDTSTTNAILNAFGVLFFLYKRNLALTLVCMLVLLLTGSNMINILLVLVFLFVIIFQSNRDRKSVILICLAMLTVFWVKISPQNNTYIAATWEKITGGDKKNIQSASKQLRITERPDSTLSPSEKKEKTARLYVDSITLAMSKTRKTAVQEILPDTVLSVTGKPLLPHDNIHTPAFQHKWDTTALQKQLSVYVKKENLEDSTVQIPGEKKLPGKILAWKQTLAFLQSHPRKLLTGAGMGNFSSKLAFRITGLGIAGNYPQQYQYVNPDFKKNHLELQLSYYTCNDSLHSLTNSPNSVYGQLLSEYGLLGVAAFIFFYLFFFAKQYKKMDYGRPVLLLMLAVFFTDYWFEQLSVVVFFELLLFLDARENKDRTAYAT